MKRLLAGTLIIMFALSLYGNISGYKCYASEAIAISTPSDLEKLREAKEDSYFYLTNDINMQGYGNWESVKNFTGTLDGCGFKIYNYKSNTGGIIDFPKRESTIKICNLIMENVAISSPGECTAGYVNSSNRNASVLISNCNISGSIVGYIYVGGIISKTDNGDTTVTISNCMNSATIIGFEFIGGICGILDEDSRIENCYNSGDLKSYNDDDVFVSGGLVGSCSGTIVNSITTGNVFNHDKTSDNEYWKLGTVIGTIDSEAYISGLYSKEIANDSELYACYDMSDTQRFESEMHILSKSEADYINSGFDFLSTWGINNGINNGFPYLQFCSQKYSLSKPKASKDSGKYNGSIEVILSHIVDETTFYYTLDGSTPSDNGNSYIYVNPVQISSTTTLKVIAVNPLYGNSSEAKYTYDFTLPKVTSNIPAKGKIKGKITIKLQCTDSGVTIFYTTDGSTPSSSSKRYNKDITISKTTTIKAIAINGIAKSNISTFKYIY